MSKLTPIKAIRKNALIVAVVRWWKLGCVHAKLARYMAIEWVIDQKANNLPQKQMK